MDTKPTTLPEVNKSPLPYNRFSKPVIVISSIVIVVLVAVFLLVKFLLQKTSREVVGSQAPTADQLVVEKKMTLVSIPTGFSFSIPNDWTSKISSQSNQNFTARFFLLGKNPETTYIEVESASRSRTFSNPLIKITKTGSLQVNGLTVSVVEGQELFANSTRLVKQVIIPNNNNYSLSMTLYYLSGDNVTALFDDLVGSVKVGESVKRSGFNLVSKVLAAEAIAGVSRERFQKIEVMGDPFPERITTGDSSYKDGYAKFYSFDAFKGQRLTTVAMEDRTTNPNSFIRTELYAENGKKIDEKDTRIEFEAPYTGTYFYIVYSFGKQQGGYLLKVFDRNQTENLVYVKYVDGTEKFVDPSKLPIYGKREVVMLIQFMNPIEVTDNAHVRYFVKPHEFTSGIGLITSLVELFGNQQSYSDFLSPHSRLPEENPQNKTPLKITRISLSKVLIEPASGGMFPKDYHLALLEQAEGTTRIFTQDYDPKVTPRPTLTGTSSPFPSTFPSNVPSPVPSMLPSPIPTNQTRALRDTRERLYVLGGNVGINADNVDAISSTVGLYDSKMGFWQAPAAMKYRRNWNAAVAIGNRIYTFGPAYVDRSLTIKAEVYNPDTNEWKEVTAPPDPHTNALGYNAFAWGSRIYLIMPAWENGSIKTAVYAYDISSDKYQRLSSPDRGVEYCAYSQAKIYCFRRDDLTMVYIYTPKTDSWDKVAIENRQRVQGGIVGYDYGIYAVTQNGYGDYGFYLFELDAARFKPVNISLDQLNSKRTVGFSVGAFGSSVVVGGGMTYNNGVAEAQKDVYIYDPAYGQDYLASMQNGRANFAMAVLPLSTSSQGAVIDGRVTENGNMVSTKASVSLYKITGKAQNGGQYTSLVVSQDVDSSGQFAFYGLDAGNYQLYVGGDYNSYSNKNFQNPITLTENQKLSNLEVTASK